MNPSNSYFLPSQPSKATTHGFPVARREDNGAFKKSFDEYKGKAGAVKLWDGLKGTRLVPQPSVYLDEALAVSAALQSAFTAAHQKTNGDGTVLAFSPHVPKTARRRSMYAVRALDHMWAFIPEGSIRERIRLRSEQTIFVSGGTYGAIERLVKYVPKPGTTYVVPTMAEVVQASAWSGFPIDDVHAPPKVYGSEVKKDNIKVQYDAAAGFPTGGKLRDPEVLRVHELLMDELLGQLDGKSWTEAEALLDRLRQTFRCWFTFMGKMKADVSTFKKAESNMDRFYNVAPAFLKLIMMRATQRLEDHLEHISLRDPPTAARTFKGGSLTHGGAMELVLALDYVLFESHSRDPFGRAHTTTGDDTFMAILFHGMLMLLSLDASSFDLTQPREVMTPIDDFIHARLTRIDPKAAHLWRWVVKSRLTTVLGTTTALFEDCGPSGIPLQSLRNDMLMGVVISRLYTVLENGALRGDRLIGGGFTSPLWTGFVASLGDKREARHNAQCPPGLLLVDGHLPEYLMTVDRVHGHELLNYIVSQVGLELGLTVRVDEVKVYHARTIRQALTQAPFLYVGYNLYTTDTGFVLPEADWPRALAQFSYPVRNYIATLFEESEVVRMASICLGCGVPGKDMRSAFWMLVFHIVAQIDKMIDQKREFPVGGVAEETVFGPGFSAKSWAGLRLALLNFARIWYPRTSLTTQFWEPTAEDIGRIKRTIRADPGMTLAKWTVQGSKLPINALELIFEFMGPIPEGIERRVVDSKKGTAEPLIDHRQVYDGELAATASAYMAKPSIKTRDDFRSKMNARLRSAWVYSDVNRENFGARPLMEKVASDTPAGARLRANAKYVRTHSTEERVSQALSAVEAHFRYEAEVQRQADAEREERERREEEADRLREERAAEATYRDMGFVDEDEDFALYNDEDTLVYNATSLKLSGASAEFRY